MRVPFFLFALSASALAHGVVLWFAHKQPSKLPTVAVELGEISVEILETLSTAPSPAIDASTKKQPEPRPETPKEAVEEESAPPPLDLPLDKINDWINSTRRAVVEAIEQVRKQPAEVPQKDEKPMPEEVVEESAPAEAPASSPTLARLGVPEKRQGVRAEAKLKIGTRPTYPFEAIQRGLEGRVLLRISIDPDGTVREVVVLESSGHVILDQAALTFARSMSLEPATVDGVPVTSDVLLPVSFKLR